VAAGPRESRRAVASLVFFIMQPNLLEAERRIEEARRTQAESLDLGDLALSELPANLGDLPHLKALCLGRVRRIEEVDLGLYYDHRSTFTDIEPLTRLHALQRLDLRRTGITDIEPLARLQALQRLVLTGSGITDIQPLARLRTLQRLHLSAGITDIEPLARLQALRSLRLSDTGITDIQPLAGLQRLQILDLYGYRLAVPAEFLRTFADQPRLKVLFAEEAVGMPREVLSHHAEDNCLPRLRAHLSELALGAEAENEVKVILLGNGRVGKTQLCRRFRGQPFDKSVPSTHGVQIWREELRIRTGGEEQVFQVNWWDFGGQDIYHGTHALFLRSRAVFLILWTPALENRDEYDENGIILRNQPLAYWLDYVRTLAGEGSPVIVVQSQCDWFSDRRPDPPRPDGLGFFECCSYSAKEDLGRDILESLLRNAIRSLLERNGALEIGHGRAEVRRRLYNWRSEDQERRSEERQHRTLTVDEFQLLCDEVGGIVSWEHALDYFHHTGVVFYNSNLFSNCIVLDQDWALDAVYTVFHRGRAIPWLRDSGRFTREDLAFMVWQDHSAEEQRLFLGLMESCGVCFACGKNRPGRGALRRAGLAAPVRSRRGPAPLLEGGARHAHAAAEVSIPPPGDHPRADERDRRAGRGSG
jgi:internalin A